MLGYRTSDSGARSVSSLWACVSCVHVVLGGMSCLKPSLDPGGGYLLCATDWTSTTGTGYCLWGGILEDKPEWGSRRRGTRGKEISSSTGNQVVSVPFLERRETGII